MISTNSKGNIDLETFQFHFLYNFSPKDKKRINRLLRVGTKTKEDKELLRKALSAIWWTGYYSNQRDTQESQRQEF